MVFRCLLKSKRETMTTVIENSTATIIPTEIEFENKGFSKLA